MYVDEYIKQSHSAGCRLVFGKINRARHTGNDLVNREPTVLRHKRVPPHRSPGPDVRTQDHYTVRVLAQTRLCRDVTTQGLYRPYTLRVLNIVVTIIVVLETS